MVSERLGSKGKGGIKMHCNCGFIGWAEVGNFGFDKEWLSMNNYRCPKCGTIDRGKFVIHSIDRIRCCLLFPEFCTRKIPLPHKERKVVEFITGEADNTTVGYSIHCPNCGWGEGSAISKEDYEKLKTLVKEGKLNIMLIEKNCETELRRFGRD